MRCPKCDKEMKIMQLRNLMFIPDGDLEEVLGRCEDCDIDATWEIFTNLEGEVEEFNFKRYFFG